MPLPRTRHQRQDSNPPEVGFAQSLADLAVGVTVLDGRDTTIIEINELGAELLNQPVADLRGRQLSELLLPADRSRLLDHVARCSAPPQMHRVRLMVGRQHTVPIDLISRCVSSEPARLHSVLFRTPKRPADERVVKQLVSAQESERRRIARELHDQIGQHLLGFSLGLRQLAQAPGLGSEAAAVLKRLEELTEVMARDVHRVASELRPTALDDLGLADALTSYAEGLSQQHALEIDVHCEGPVRIDAIAETVIYRIAQEALTNIVKHANASRISVLLETHGPTVQLIIEDDGCGFDVDGVLNDGPIQRRLGLAGMVERAALINGDLHIESTPERGTTLFLRVMPRAEEVPPDEKTTPAPG